MTRNPIAAVGKLGDVKFHRLRAGLSQTLQYQLSFRSAGG